MSEQTEKTRHMDHLQQISVIGDVEWEHIETENTVTTKGFLTAGIKNVNKENYLEATI